MRPHNWTDFLFAIAVRFIRCTIPGCLACSRLSICWLIASAMLLQTQRSHCVGLTATGNYDGSNFITCASYAVGPFFGQTYSVGTMFRFSGGERLTLPLRNSGSADASNFRLSIVAEDIWNPTVEVIWSGTPGGVGPSDSNHSYVLDGIVQGGQNYWLLFETIAVDSGYYAWPFASSPLTYCGQDVPPDSGSVASRSSATGPPTGPWNFQVDIRPAFLIEGNRLSAPAGYYDSAQGKGGQELRTALHAIIHNHHVIPYSSGSQTDTSDALKLLDRDGANTNDIIEIYSGSNAPASSFGLTTGWNREHVWPNSYGLDDVEPSYSDLYNLRACDATVNSSRGNKYYDTTATNSAGYAFPAHPEAPLCSTDSDSWEPPLFDRGNIARSLFYMAIRYTGDAASEPALVLTDDPGQINSVSTYMGKLSTLLAWHQADPVDAPEELRDDRVYSLHQTNRNPFVDHPEWVNLTFAPADTNRPVLNIAPAPTGIVLTWLATNQSTRLEFTTNLPDFWQDAPVIPALSNGQFLVHWTNLSARAFFRLR
jgi:endonuclease I